MATWMFVMEYIDKREVRIEADTEDEARAKMDSGEFEDEHTVDFFAYNLVRELHKESDT
jgi:hypothetical protein